MPCVSRFSLSLTCGDYGSYTDPGHQSGGGRWTFLGECLSDTSSKQLERRPIVTLFSLQLRSLPTDMFTMVRWLGLGSHAYGRRRRRGASESSEWGGRGCTWCSRPAHATNLPKLAAKNVKNRPSAEFDTEIGASGGRHFLSFAEGADYGKRGRCNAQSWTELLFRCE